MKREFDSERFKKLARALRVVFNVFYYLGIGGAALAAIFSQVILFIPDQVFSSENIRSSYYNLSMDGLVTYKIDPALAAGVNIKPIMFTIALTAAVAAIVVTPIFKQLAGLLKAVSQDKPFVPENAKRLNRVGFILIFLSLVISIGRFAVAWRVVSAYKIPNITIAFKFDTITFLVGLLVILLGGIFRYGSYLQKEYDSTV